MVTWTIAGLALMHVSHILSSIGHSINVSTFPGTRPKLIRACVGATASIHSLQELLERGRHNWVSKRGGATRARRQPALLLLLPSANGTGGIEHYNRTLIEQFGRIGVRLHVVTLLDDRPPDLSEYGDEYTSQSATGSRMRFAALIMLFALRYRPVAILAGHVHLAPACLMMRVLGLTRRYAVIIYGLEVWDRLQPVRRAALGRADLVVSISQYTANQAQRSNKLTDLPMRYLPPPVHDRWLIPPASTSQGLIPRLLTVGRLEALEGEKGIDRVLVALNSSTLAREPVGIRRGR